MKMNKKIDEIIHSQQSEMMKRTLILVYTLSQMRLIKQHFEISTCWWSM